MHYAAMHLDREACYRALLTRDARFDGRFYVAVRTTGIYCRPICPARAPKLENIVFVPSAAAAQAAGFRPCLRCRPETSPDIAAWHGTSTTVSRAVALIAAGALNDNSVDGLATRLGMGERQLRRLFQKHLGASPNAVAQTRRSLFAKQLLTDTRLSMTEVALASGFGSVRRFNDTFQKLYGRAPRTLRRDGAMTQTPASAVTLTLAYRPPFDWPAIVGFLTMRAIPGVEEVRPDRYSRTISLGDVHGTIVVRQADPRHNPHALLATIRYPDVTALPAIVDRIRRIFDLGADPTIIAEHLSADRDLGAAGRQASGPAGTRCLGRFRTRGTGHPGPTDHGRRRDPPRRQIGCCLWRAAAAVRRPGRTGPALRVPRARPAGRMQSGRDPRHAGRPSRRDPGHGGDGHGKFPAFRTWSYPRGRRQPPAGTAWHR